VQISNPCKSRVGLLSAFTGLADFHLQTPAKTLTIRLAQQTVASPHHSTKWHYVRGKLHPHTANHLKQTAATERQKPASQPVRRQSRRVRGSQKDRGTPRAGLPTLGSWQEVRLLRCWGAERAATPARCCRRTAHASSAPQRGHARSMENTPVEQHWPHE